jgi:hypothetical protein
MQALTRLLAFVLVACASTVARGDEDAGEANPVSKVLQLLSEMQQKILAQGTSSQKTYDEFAEWCEDRSVEIRNEIKISKAEVGDLQAAIEKQANVIEAASTKIEELSSAISTDEADLKAATLIRGAEAKTFGKEEQELMSTIDQLERAVSILEREMKGGAALVQIKNAATLAQALTAIVDASSLSSDSTQKLTALLQSNDAGKLEDGEEEDSEFSSEEEALGAPDPEAYKKKSGTIIETLEGLLEKAEAQLDDLRKTEEKRSHNFKMLKQSLEDRLTNAKKDMDQAKKDKAEAGEAKASDEGDLTVTKKDLGEDIKTLGNLHHNCMTKATDFEEETKSRGEELHALAAAKSVIQEMTGAATAQAYDSAASFAQMKMKTDTSTMSPDLQAVHQIKRLARHTRSRALMLFSTQLDQAIRSAAMTRDDPFAKVKGMISDMLAKLLAEAGEEAQKKAYCDKEMGETGSKKEDKEDEIEKLTTKIDQASALSTKLQEEVAVLQKELSEIAKAQAQMDKIRAEEKAKYEKSRPELEQGIKGIQMALKVLRDYYSKDAKHESSDGAGSNIIGMLEVAESDFSKGLSDMISEEEAAQTSYEETTQENELATATKDADVTHKTKESKSLSKNAAELSSDRDGVNTELAAVMEYYAKLTEECVAKAEPYEERKKRREQEIAGLKQALQTLQSEASFLQEGSERHLLRGVRHHRN